MIFLFLPNVNFNFRQDQLGPVLLVSSLTKVLGPLLRTLGRLEILRVPANGLLVLPAQKQVPQVLV